jgi:hypothetical protein
MAIMTEELITKNLGAFADIGVQRHSSDGWVVTFPWGRRVTIKETYVDFRGIEQLLPGESEDLNPA